MAKRNTLSTTAKNTAAAAAPAEVTVAKVVTTAMSSTLSKPAASASPADAPADSKQFRLVTLLRRTEGATIAELMAATGWMSHSVRGALSAVVKRKLGLTVESSLEIDRGRVYRVAPPSVTKPATSRRKAKPATPRASASSAAA